MIQKGARPLVTVQADDAALPPRLAVLAAGRRTTSDLCAYLKPQVADAAAHENRTQTPSCKRADAAF